MSDQNSDLTSEKIIELLEKALIRERNTKKTLQDMLEKKAQEKFDQNKELLFAVEKAAERQVQFNFLTTLTEELLSTQEIDLLCNNFITKLSTFMEGCPSIQMCLKINENNSMTSLPSPTSEWLLMPWLASYQSCIDYMFTCDELIWHREEPLEGGHRKELEALTPLLKNNTLLFLVINISSLQKRIIILDINHYCYSDDFKETLNIAGKQFSLAIKRRVAKEELGYNYEVLKNVLSDLETSQKQLAQNEKMASLGQLSAGIAHEINNPIGYIASNFDTLLDYLKTYEDAFTKINNTNIDSILADEELAYVRGDISALTHSCIEGVERISEIVNSLKSFSRQEDDQHQKTNINDVITSSLKIVWNKIKYDHQLEEHFLDNPPAIMANYGQLQQVFINLFVNAVHAMATSGKITITTSSINNHLIVSVKDTGCGMNDEVCRRVFEPFYTTKSENEGTGLGLSVSYAIIEKHNATVDVRSEQGNGTEFILSFPCCMDD